MPVRSEAIWAELSAPTVLRRDDGTNVNGAILASDGGWSAL